MNRLAVLLMLVALLVLLGACAHTETIQVPVACIKEPAKPPANRVTNDQLARARPEKFPTLAAARIHQDAGYIGELEAQVATCARIPSP